MYWFYVPWGSDLSVSVDPLFPALSSPQWAYRAGYWGAALIVARAQGARHTAGCSGSEHNYGGWRQWPSAVYSSSSHNPVERPALEGVLGRQMAGIFTKLGPRECVLWSSEDWRLARIREVTCTWRKTLTPTC
ncbi:hypothetical protein IG193_04600 [Infirmifilum lucidum]|uniref:Uncharacterized protein n=1 Tax=Infirmifilum lucidum TaxID=2776706 RepID=A0A7L9FE47_9CREN|nr:hypothetical protein [Infirmifilum lucidum]QOJ78078.1 hypothetical protein IG193_04600 [Infirmifilum lucidum]